MRSLTIAFLVAVMLAACGGGGPSAAPLTDAQRLWCAAHDMTPIQDLVDLGSTTQPIDDAVLETAAKLGISIPDSVKSANDGWNAYNLGVKDTNVADDWETVLADWRKTSDYTRACVAAFDLRK